MENGQEAGVDLPAAAMPAATAPPAATPARAPRSQKTPIQKEALELRSRVRIQRLLDWCCWAGCLSGRACLTGGLQDCSRRCGSDVV